MIKKVLVVASILFFTSVSWAQSCPFDYTNKDEAYVKAQFDQITDVLNRLHELAVMANEYDLAPQTQRAALNAEYQALLTYINTAGDGPHSQVKKKTKVFLSNVVDSSYLDLTGTTIDASTKEEAVSNAYLAITATHQGLAKLWRCL